MTAITKTIPMQAFGKARPRVTRNGTFMPSDYQANRDALAWQFGPAPDGLVRLSVTAVRAMPKGWSKRRRAEMRGLYVKTKPDIDNIVGAVMDALFSDDARVVALGECVKVWGDDHEMIITVEGVAETAVPTTPDINRMVTAIADELGLDRHELGNRIAELQARAIIEESKQ